jgi:hypothetical protein
MQRSVLRSISHPYLDGNVINKAKKLEILLKVASNTKNQSINQSHEHLKNSMIFVVRDKTSCTNRLAIFFLAM